MPEPLFKKVAGVPPVTLLKTRLWHWCSEAAFRICSTKVIVGAKVKIGVACNFIKKRHQHRCFPLNVVKFLRTNFFYRTLLMAVSGCFTEDFPKIFKKHLSSRTLPGEFFKNTIRNIEN